MAEIEAEQQKPKKRLSLSGLFLPLLIGATISIIVVFFVVGYISLTEPSHPPEDMHSLMNEKQQEDAATLADNNTENAPEMVVNEDGTFDFAQYRYFSFPLPFVVNFADGNGMMTLEIAIATYETTLRGERLIEKLTTFTPKMRSAINLVLAEQIHDAVNTVAKRKALEKLLLATIKPVIDGTNPERPSGITDLYLTKFVITNTR